MLILFHVSDGPPSQICTVTFAAECHSLDNADNHSWWHRAIAQADTHRVLRFVHPVIVSSNG
jgi:hypothetical protein